MFLYWTNDLILYKENTMLDLEDSWIFLFISKHESTWELVSSPIRSFCHGSATRISSNCPCTERKWSFRVPWREDPRASEKWLLLLGLCAVVIKGNWDLNVYLRNLKGHKLPSIHHPLPSTGEAVTPWRDVSSGYMGAGNQGLRSAGLRILVLPPSHVNEFRF